MACALTTRDLVKTYMGITGTSKDAVIDQLISALSAAIATYCDRNFCTTNYRGFVETVLGNILYLPQHPVTKLKRIVSCMLDIMKVTTTKSNAKAASVQVSHEDLEVRLYQWGTVESEEGVDLTVATSLTVLKGVIEALAGLDWQASIVSGYETVMTTELVDMPGQPALSPDYAELQIPDYDSTFYALQLTRDNGRVESMRGHFPDGRVFVEYTAGYGAAPADLPADLVGLATKIIATAVRQAGKDLNLTGERLGDYSWSAGNTATTAIELLDRFTDELTRWRRVSLG